MVLLLYIFKNYTKVKNRKWHKKVWIPCIFLLVSVHLWTPVGNLRPGSQQAPGIASSTHQTTRTPLESCAGVSVRAMTDRSIRLKSLWFTHFIKHFRLARPLVAGLGLAVGIYAGQNFLTETSNFRPLCIPGELHLRLRAAKEKKKKIQMR